MGEAPILTRKVPLLPTAGAREGKGGKVAQGQLQQPGRRKAHQLQA